MAWLWLIFFVLANLACAQSTRADFPPLGKLVDVGGYRLHLYCTGSGPQTVMIVGAGGSFEWGLVQPEVARFTRVCTYDPAGTAWSDPNPKRTAESQISDIAILLKRSNINGPLILVGHSIGAVVARLYAARYPKQVVGMVLIDHAGGFRLPPGTKPLLMMRFDEDPSFAKLPQLNQRLWRWAQSLPKGQSLSAPEMLRQSETLLAETTKQRRDPLGTAPLIVIANRDLQSSTEYRKLAATLLALSHHSKELVASYSSHNVPIDQPEIIVAAILDVLDSAKH